MRYRIEYANGKCCNFANSSKDLIEWLKLLKDETISDIRKIYKNGVTDSVKEKYQKEKLAEYEVENNPVLSFIEDQGKESIVNELTDDVFTRYQVFCADNGLQAGSKITFSKQLVRALSLKIVTAHPYINGKRTTKKMFSE